MCFIEISSIYVLSCSFKWKLWKKSVKNVFLFIQILQVLSTSLLSAVPIRAEIIKSGGRKEIVQDIQLWNEKIEP